ncbi:MAG TPA: CHAD domain-containing protein [Hyphomonadaceae bacterium]
MSFLLEAGERPGSGLERTIREQIKKLKAECGGAPETPAVFAHKARVRTKKIRAALRLARPLMPGKAYRADNRWWRDAARSLSGLRDAGARLEALEALRPFLTRKVGEAGVLRLSERFERQRQTVDAAKAIDAFQALMAEGHSAPKIASGKRHDAVAALEETYRAARRAMKVALEERDPETLHEWRKQTKYHALQARLMRSMFPELLPRVGAVRDLSDKLGEVQDIEIVLAGIKGWRTGPKGLADALKQRRDMLVAEAESEGLVLFSEKPKAWAKALASPPASLAEESGSEAEPTFPGLLEESPEQAPALDRIAAEADVQA